MAVLTYYTIDTYAIVMDFETVKAVTLALLHYNVWYAVHPVPSDELGHYEFEVVVERSEKQLLTGMYTAEKYKPS